MAGPRRTLDACKIYNDIITILLLLMNCTTYTHVTPLETIANPKEADFDTRLYLFRLLLTRVR